MLEPPDQVLELFGNAPGFVHGLTNALGIKRRPPSVAGDLALDEPAERDTDRSCAEASAIRSPCFVFDLHSRHPVTRRSETFLCALFTLPSSSSHVYVVDDVADALEE